MPSTRVRSSRGLSGGPGSVVQPSAGLTVGSTAQTYTGRDLRASRAIKGVAWALVAAGVAAPAVRRRLKLSPKFVLGAAYTAPVALCVAAPRNRTRDVAVCLLNM